MVATTARSLRFLLAGLVIAGLAGFAPERDATAQPPIPGRDPLVPRFQREASSGVTACVACHGEEEPIDPKTNPFARRYKSHEFVLFNEGLTWNRKDPHSRAHEVLNGPLGRQMSKFLAYDVTKAPQCLTCHAADTQPGAPLPPAKGAEKDIAARFVTAEGVTCNVCHGLRQPWQTIHYEDKEGKIPWRIQTPAEKEQAGMRNLRDPGVRGQLCATCHVGSAADNRVVTHEMYAAGHPPLPPFELATFLESLPPHWKHPTDPELKFFAPEGFAVFAGAEFVKANPRWTWDLYRFHRPEEEVPLVRSVVAGAVATLQAEMRVLFADAGGEVFGQRGVDFARFDCHACHRALSDSPTRPAARFGSSIKTAAGALAAVMAEHAARVPGLEEVARVFPERWGLLQRSPGLAPLRVQAELARDMDKWCDEFMRGLDKGSPIYTPRETARLLALIEGAVAKWADEPEVVAHLIRAYLTVRRAAGRPAAEEVVRELELLAPIRVRPEPYSGEDGKPLFKSRSFKDWLQPYRTHDRGKFMDVFRRVVQSTEKK